MTLNVSSNNIGVSETFAVKRTDIVIHFLAFNFRSKKERKNTPIVGYVARYLLCGDIDKNGDQKMNLPNRTRKGGGGGLLNEI